jgi:DNA-binding transcriptional LysR family regulator
MEGRCLSDHAPGVHAQVRRLERELGVRFFEQAAKDRTVPTRAGRHRLAFCGPFFERLPDVARVVASGAAAGPLRIEAGALEIQEILPAWMRRSRRRQLAHEGRTRPVLESALRLTRAT